ncbi:MAG: HPr(Ser) kinase/phosphatase [Gammaproteobacteria bacterium]
MASHITVKKLFETHKKGLGLQWKAGRIGGTRKISLLESSSDDVSIVDDLEPSQTSTDSLIELSPKKSLIGYFNLIHPNQIQVLGKTEISYISELRSISREEAIKKLIGLEPDLIILAEGQEAPSSLVDLCEQMQIPLTSSKRSSSTVIGDLDYYLSNMLTEVTTIHGVFMEIVTIGVLIVGESGVGKSELAVELITRGHRLIADDAPEFKRIAPDTINGTCPKALTNFLEVRGLGVINVRELFGSGAVKQHKFLRLIIRLERFDSDRMKSVDRLEGSYRPVNILGLDIPEITLPVAPGRNLAVMVECATRNHILRLSGYNSTEDFMQQQRLMMESN